MSHHPFQQLKRQFWPLWYRAQVFMDLPLMARILRYRKIRERYYTQFWADAARAIGAQLSVDEFGFTRISKNGRTTFVRQYQVMLDDHLTLDIMGNKALTYQLLADLGAPIAPHLAVSIDTIAEAISFLNKNSPVVIKPASGTGGGRGVTTGISSPRQLKTAARLAARFDDRLIVEKQIEGSSYRLLFLNGKFIDAIRREPPRVTGDGVSTIRQLIKLQNKTRENNMPVRALSPLVVDRDARNWLRDNNMSLSDVPARGGSVQVKRATNENSASENVNVTKDVNSEIIFRCGELVNKLGVKFAGVDLICRDIAGEFVAENCCIGEINTTPGLHHHYLIANPDEGTRVAELVLEHMFENNTGVMDIRPVAKAGKRISNPEKELVDELR